MWAEKRSQGLEFLWGILPTVAAGKRNSVAICGISAENAT